MTATTPEWLPGATNGTDLGQPAELFADASLAVTQAGTDIEVVPQDATTEPDGNQSEEHYCPEYHSLRISAEMLADPARKDLWPGEGFIDAQRLRVARACAAFEIASPHCGGLNTDNSCPMSVAAWGAVEVTSQMPAVVHDLPAAKPKNPIGFQMPNQTS